MSPLFLVLLYCVFIVGASLLGGWLPALMKLTHTRLQLMMSFVSGLMLGVSLLHMLPHAAAQVELERAVPWMLAGVLTMFVLIRAFHIHQHGTDAEHAHGHGAKHELSWVGVAIGMGLHTAIDGVALAAAVAAEAEHDHVSFFVGAGTFLAVLLHKPLDALAITSLMSAGGWKPSTRQLVNAGFALMCPLGAALFFLGVGDGHGTVVGSALAFSAGVFLCIALADLLPEIQFHSHDRLALFAALLLGVAAAWAIGFLEPHELHRSG